MNERERWIVYPLLFLALGASLRDKLIDRMFSKSIICQELIVADEDIAGHGQTRILARIGRTEPTATQPSVGYLGVNGVVEVNGVIQAKNLGYPPITLENVLRGLKQSLGGANAANAPAGDGAEGAARNQNDSPQRLVPEKAPPDGETPTDSHLKDDK